MVFKDLEIKHWCEYHDFYLNPIHIDLCGTTDGWGAKGLFLLRKTRQIYSTMIKLGTVVSSQRKSKKNMNHVTHRFRSADISILSLEIIKFCYINKYRYRLHFNT